MNAIIPVSDLSLLEPAKLNQQYSYLHVEPVLIDTSRDRIFEILISNFGSTMQLLPKRMIVAYSVAEPAVIVELSNKQASFSLQENLNLACTKLRITAFQYKPTEDREVQMTQQKNVEWKDF